MKVTAARRELQVQAQLLRAEGLMYREIADALRVSRSFAAELCDPRAQAKRDARRRRYEGICERCEGVTKSNGTSHPSRICSPCALEQTRETKVWTRESILDAIRRFAAAEGRPPKADDWIRADCARAYPSRGSVYGHGTPFATWADAIEEAGFLRPIAGKSQGDTRPNAMGGALADLIARDTFGFRDVQQLAGSGNRAASWLTWWHQHGYVDRLARGVYRCTGKRPRTLRAEAA